tara:strand:+ start:121 stop:324 length:204 start_codon:yes stop_codon:yes gene_type:complete
MTRIQRGVRNALFDMGIEINELIRGKRPNPFPINAKYLHLVLKGKQHLISIELEAELLDYLQKKNYL